MWTDDVEKQIKYIGDCARGCVWMYRNDSQEYSNRSSRIIFITFLLGVCSGILSIISSAIGSDTTAISIVSGILAFGTVSVSSFGTTKQFDVLSSEAKRTASRYAAIADNIRRQLSLPRDSRERAHDYYHWISKSYEDLNENSLDCLDQTISAYRLICKETGNPFPGDVELNISIYSGLPEETPLPKAPLNDLTMRYEMSRLNSHH